jgi:L-asparaginase
MDSAVEIRSGTLLLADLKGSTLALAHGGAGPQDPTGESFRAAQATLDAILKKSPGSGTSPEMVAFVAKELEADPQFNAGYGASIQADGVVRLSASYMDSANQRFAAVMNVEDVVHPSLLALHLCDQRFCILDATGAEQLAKRLELPKANLVSQQRFKRWLRHKRESFNPAGKTGTIGCVALDSSARLAALTSTGGVGNETPGRVGDTPTIAGNYCSEDVAVSCTGIGEQIINHALSPRIAIYFDQSRDLKEALTRALVEAERKDYRFAAIALAFEKETGRAHWAAGSVNSHLLWGARGVFVSN